MASALIKDHKNIFEALLKILVNRRENQKLFSWRPHWMYFDCVSGSFTTTKREKGLHKAAAKVRNQILLSCHQSEMWANLKDAGRLDLSG